jgi:hypothetical protein
MPSKFARQLTKESIMILDTPETLKALGRTNDIAKVRKLALNKINMQMRNASSLEGLKQAIEQILVETDTVERNIVKS